MSVYWKSTPQDITSYRIERTCAVEKWAWATHEILKRSQEINMCTRIKLEAQRRSTDWEEKCRGAQVINNSAQEN